MLLACRATTTSQLQQGAKSQAEKKKGTDASNTLPHLAGEREARAARCSRDLGRALDWGLVCHPRPRTSSVAEVRSALHIERRTPLSTRASKPPYHFLGSTSVNNIIIEEQPKTSTTASPKAHRRPRSFTFSPLDPGHKRSSNRYSGQISATPSPYNLSFRNL